ncbi:putative nucleic acid-binding Zn-ribbon protein [Bradyrhizobium liaoningense]
MQIRNFHHCAEYGHEWTHVGSSQCDDDCPHCGSRHMSPYKSEDAEESMTNRIALLNDDFRRNFRGGKIMIVDSNEAGHAFQFEAGRVFRSEAGHPWRRSHGSIS